MTLFQTTVPDIGVSVDIQDCRLIDSVRSLSLSGSRLTAQLEDGLSEEDYELASKEIRILYSFCFEQVYSEDYDVATAEVHYSHGGHNERKEHLLAENTPVSQEFGSVGKQLFEDIARLDVSASKLLSFINSAFVWSRANELQELYLLTEAYTQYWRLLDLVCQKANLSQAETDAILAEYKIRKTQSNRFAIRILHKMEMLRAGKTSNIESMALLGSLRHPHAHQAGGRSNYFMEDETHLEAEIHNVFISDITKLFVIWELGLRDYYLKPRANIYQLAKK